MRIGSGHSTFAVPALLVFLAISGCTSERTPEQLSFESPTVRPQSTIQSTASKEAALPLAAGSATGIPVPSRTSSITPTPSVTPTPTSTSIAGSGGEVLANCDGSNPKQGGVYRFDLSSFTHQRIHPDYPQTPDLFMTDGIGPVSPDGKWIIWSESTYTGVTFLGIRGFQSQSSQTQYYISPVDFSMRLPIKYETQFHLKPPLTVTSSIGFQWVDSHTLLATEYYFHTDWVSVHGSEYHLYLYDRLAARTFPVLDIPDGTALGQVVFSPSREYAVLETHSLSGVERNNRLILINLREPSSQTLALPGSPADVHQDISWSPDSRSFVYSNLSDSNLYEFDVATNEANALAEGIKPEWDPSGEAISFIRDGKIWTIDVETGVEKEIPTSPAKWGVVEQSMSPDGRTMLYVAEIQSCCPRLHELRLLNLEDGKETVLMDVQVEPMGYLFRTYDVQWSPDANWLTLRTRIKHPQYGWTWDESYYCNLTKCVQMVVTGADRCFPTWPGKTSSH